MKQEILFIILNEYADWEGAFIAACLNAGVMPGSEVKYTPKVVAPTLDAVAPSVASARCPTTVSRLCPQIMQHWF